MKKTLTFLCLLFLTFANAQTLERDPCTLPSAKEEKLLFPQLSRESRRLYLSLDCEGKNRVFEFSYEDKNQAVQEAAKEMGQRQLQKFEEGPTYPNQVEEEADQEDFNENRYGH